MCVEKLPICGHWQLQVALFTDVTNLKELRQSVVDGQLDVALISPTMVCVREVFVHTNCFGRRLTFSVDSELSCWQNSNA